MSRRPATHGVTLFPFLDVLVSAMGSLILLLLITTYHNPRKPDDVSPLALPAEVEVQDDSEKREAEALARAQRQAEYEARMAAQRQALAEHERHTQTVHAQWQSNLNAMEERNQELMRQAIQIKQVVEEQASEVSKSESQRQRLAEMIAAAEQRNSAQRQSEVDLQKQVMDLLEQRKAIQSELETQKVAQAIRKPVFEVIAHDGNSGTDRRPILVECRADGLVFASEQVQVTAKDLAEYGPEHNPLLAGAEALTTYWTLADAQKGEKNSRPYVLLIVRPSGTIGFYVARKYLEKLNHEYGYELVPENAEIKWPAADPDAVEVCRTAVERARQESRVYSSAGVPGFGANGKRGPGGGSGGPGGGPGSGRTGTGEQIVGANGEFQLPEVENMKNSSPKDSIGMLGPEWSRQKRTGGSLSEIDPSKRTGLGVPGNSQRTNGTEAAQSESATAANSSAAEASGSGISPRAAASSDNPYGTDTTARNSVPGGMPGGTSDGGRSRSSVYDRKPDMPNSPLAERQAGMPQDGGVERQWGRPGRSGAIGIEREIIFQLYADRVAIVDGASVTLPPDIGRGEFHEIVAAMIQTQALNWGDPPQKFIWRPRLKIEIYPGGNQHYGRLKELLTHWGISSKVEHKLN